MLYIDPIIMDEMFLPAQTNSQTEVEKAKEIRDQLNNSIDWMNFIAPNEKDAIKKSDLLKDITAASRERERLNKELNSIKV